MEWLRMQQWSPYVVGIGLGILSWLTFLLSDHALGCSTAFIRLSGMLEKIFRKQEVEAKEYYQQFEPIVDWQVMLVFGIVLGAFLSAILSGSMHFELTPALWENHFGNTPWLRFGASLLGGMLIGFGARWVNGGTCGHGISGLLQMAISSWLTVIFMVLGGIATAFLLYS